MSVEASVEYKDGVITYTLAGEGQVKVCTRPATEKEWVEVQKKLAELEFTQH